MIGLDSLIAALALHVPGGSRERLQPLTGERGQAFVEYVLLITLVAITAAALLAAWTGVVGAITTALTTIGNTITNP